MCSFSAGCFHLSVLIRYEQQHDWKMQRRFPSHSTVVEIKYSCVRFPPRHTHITRLQIKPNNITMQANKV